MTRFVEHLSGCGQCSATYSEFLALNAGLVEGDEELIEALRKPVRNAVLEAVSEITPEPVATATMAVFPPLRNSHWFGMAWATGLGTAAIAGSFWLGSWYSSSAPVRLEIQAAKAPSVVLSPAKLKSDSANTSAAEQQRNQQLQTELEKRQRELALADRRESELQQQIASETKDLAATQALLADKTERLKQIEDARSSDSALQVALRVQIQDLTEKLSSQNQSLARERQLLSHDREVRDIIGARNLHIIDVYDTDTRGHTKQAFARAFYTEGRSLVFYAYDLPTDPGRENQEYVAWGQAEGRRSSIKNLGMLVKDDKGQRRWALNFSDPNVLAEIDSVFITLETKPDAGSPSGKRMLTAYLNDTANHP
jgi:hypothetical protein